MTYTALYRKYRPDTFDEVAGQEAVVTTLRNQIVTGRVGHAYLFCGTRGTGKTTAAKIFARGVNCLHPVNGSPCNECAVCRSIISGRSLNVIEIDAASNNGVDNIREIREEVAYSPAEGNYKVYIIDEVHMLSGGAFNALLKTLEEPPAWVIFILATTEAHKVPATILSRCQRYDFRRIPLDTISARVAELLEREGVDAEDKAVRYIARKAEGGMRDALSLADQCISYYMGEKLTYGRVLEVLGAVDIEVFSLLLKSIVDQDVAAVLKQLRDLIDQGRDLQQLNGDMVWYLRNLMLIKASDQVDDSLDVSEEDIPMLLEQASMIRSETLFRYIQVFSEMEGRLRNSANRRVLLEMTLIRLCRPQMQTDELALADRIRALERQLSEGVVISAPAGTRDAGDLPVPETGPAGGADYVPGTGGAGGRSTPHYDKAAPADLQQIQSQWKSIISGLRPRFRQVLADAKLNFAPGSGETSELYVVFRDFLGEPYMHNESAGAELEEAVAEKTGIRVPIRFLLEADRALFKEPIQEINVQEALRSVINMDIEEE